MSNIIIYILELHDNKYYVGRTKNINFRLEEHFNNSGSAWTMKHKPVKPIEIINNCDIYDEDKYTIKMMAQYGIENVRGGSFTKLVLSNEEKYIINKMINNANDKCFICYGNDHFVSYCPYTKVKNHDLLLLKHKIIKLCQENDKYNSKIIEIKNLINILIQSDSEIFNGITEKDIHGLCKEIKIDIIKGSVNYKDFAYGLIILFNDVI